MILLNLLTILSITEPIVDALKEDIPHIVLKWSWLTMDFIFS